MIPQCGVDGFYSNMRQVFASLFFFHKLNQTGTNFVAAQSDMYYREQHSGSVGKTVGPVPYHEIFDAPYLSKTLNHLVLSADAFASKWQPACEPKLVHVTYTKAARMFRCGDVKKDVVWTHKDSFINNSTQITNDDMFAVAKQYQNSSTCVRIMFDATNSQSAQMRVDIERLGYLLSRGKLISYIGSDALVVANTIRFNANIVKYKTAIAKKWGLKHCDVISEQNCYSDYAAMHIRRGNTYAIRNEAGQASKNEIYHALQSMEDRGVLSGCTPVPIRTIVLCSLSPESDRAIINEWSKQKGLNITVKMFSEQLWEGLNKSLSSDLSRRDIQLAVEVNRGYTLLHFCIEFTVQLYHVARRFSLL